jgi:hypothetical protein
LDETQKLMKIEGIPYRSIWLNRDGWSVDIIDQTRLPHEFEIRPLRCLDDAAEAISAMRVRGAPLIGATAAYGVSCSPPGRLRSIYAGPWTGSETFLMA